MDSANRSRIDVKPSCRIKFPAGRPGRIATPIEGITNNVSRTFPEAECRCFGRMKFHSQRSPQSVAGHASAGKFRIWTEEPGRDAAEVKLADGLVVAARGGESCGTGLPADGRVDLFGAHTLRTGRIAATDASGRRSTRRAGAPISDIIAPDAPDTSPRELRPARTEYS